MDMIDEAEMREALEAQVRFLFSGRPPDVTQAIHDSGVITAIIDALVTDAAFVEATKTVAERIAFHASRISADRGFPLRPD